MIPKREIISKGDVVFTHPHKEIIGRFSTRFNFNSALWPNTVIVGPSVTVPDSVYTVAQMMERYVKGHPLPKKPDVAFFNEEYSLPVTGDRDFVDVDLSREALERRNSILDIDIKTEKAHAKETARKFKEFQKQQAESAKSKADDSAKSV